jgi:tripeptide aminopeptidase
MTSSAQLRIARLAAAPAVHRAFHWLHLHQIQVRRWQLEMLRIPAPPFGEQARAEWFLERFQQLGLANPHLDEAGNAMAEFPGSAGDATIAATSQSPVLLLSAHLDTVFPNAVPIEPVEIETRILAPGACDNASGLSALLGLAAAMLHAGINPPVPIVFFVACDICSRRVLTPRASPPHSRWRVEATTPWSHALSPVAGFASPLRALEATRGRMPAR